VWANFTHFCILKIWFLTIREINISRYLAMSGNFLNFWGLKMRFAQSWNTRFKGTKFRVSEFSVLPNLPHFGSLKFDFCRFVKPFQGTSQRVEIFLIFEAWKWVLDCRVIHVARIPNFVLWNFPHFGSLKMRFLPIREINVSSYLAKMGEILLIFESRKCDFALSWNPRLKGTNLHTNKFSTFW